MRTDSRPRVCDLDVQVIGCIVIRPRVLLMLIVVTLLRMVVRSQISLPHIAPNLHLDQTALVDNREAVKKKCTGCIQYTNIVNIKNEAS